MSKKNTVYITDRDDHGKLFDRLVAVVNDELWEVELAPGLTILSADGCTRVEGSPADA